MHHDVKVSKVLIHLVIFAVPYKCTKYMFVCFYFQVLWDRVKVAVGHPDFAEKLRAFIAAYNAKHF